MLMVKSKKWHARYLSLAREVSTWSKDPSTKIGSVAVGENGQILSQGYNGFPRGIEDTEERLHNREEKYNYVVHAEKNCIYNACLNGVSLKGSNVFVHGLPVCNECCKGLLQVGVKGVIMGNPPGIHESWEEKFLLTKSKLLEAKIPFVRYEYFFNQIEEASLKLIDGWLPATQGCASERIAHNGKWERKDFLEHHNISH